MRNSLNTNKLNPVAKLLASICGNTSLSQPRSLPHKSIVYNVSKVTPEIKNAGAVFRTGTEIKAITNVKLEATHVAVQKGATLGETFSNVSK